MVKRTSLRDYPCSIARALDAAGEWWSPLIVRDVAYGVTRFRELQEDLGVSANVLADRLDTLVAEGILGTHVYQQRPLRSEYRLTDKGRELVPVLLALMQWGDRWTWDPPGGPVRVLHEHCGSEARVQIRCPECVRELAPEELRAVPGRPPADPPREGEPSFISGRRLYGAAEGINLAS